MKKLSLLVWITQLGLSVAVPLGGFVWLAVWLRERFHWGNWVIFLGILLGLYTAVQGLINTLKTIRRISGDDHQEKNPPVSYNEHV